MSLNYNNVIKKMLCTISELRSIYDKEVEWYDGEIPGLHLVFGDVFNPYLINLLHDTNNRDQILEQIFIFLEEMALSNDLKVKEVLACTVLERLGDEPFILEKAKRYMRSNTLKLSEEVEKGWGRFQKQNT